MRLCQILVSLLSALFLLSCTSKGSVQLPEGIEATSQVGLLGKAQMAISTAEPKATEAAVEMVYRGGNLVDAFVAASFAVSVLRPQSTGIGGGGFLIYHDAKTGESEAWDFREVAPQKAHSRMYYREGQLDSKLALNGALAVAVPGFVAGLYAFHQKYGKLKWHTLLEPAIRYAEEGAEVSKHMAMALEIRKDVLLQSPSMKQIFFNGEVPLREGQVFIQKDLAKTLFGIATEGRDYFYKGEFAQKLTKWMATQKGLIGKDDLELYRIKRRKALQANWKHYKIVSMPPPSSGGVALLQMLKIYDYLSPSFKKTAGDRVANIEIFKRVYADRAIHIGDPDFVDVPVKKLLGDEYLKTRALQIEELGITESKEISAWNEEIVEAYGVSDQTTHISMMDADGSAISSTQTINYYFGAGVMAPGTGVVLNDEMADFDLDSAVMRGADLIRTRQNEIRAGKRPMSSMTPTLVLNKANQVLGVLGTPGGPRIITSVYHVLSSIYRDYKTPDYAISKCRYHHQWIPDKVVVESLCAPRFGNIEMKYRGMDVKESELWGDMQIAGQKSNGALFSVVDPRGHGKPMLIPMK